MSKITKCKKCKWIIGHDWSCSINNTHEHVFARTYSKSERFYEPDLFTIQCIYCLRIRALTAREMKKIKNNIKIV
jgi:hypothetical protein